MTRVAFGWPLAAILFACATAPTGNPRPSVVELDLSRVREVSRAHLRALEGCFAERLTREPDPNGVKLSWSISADGRAQQVHVNLVDFEDEMLASCLSDEMAKWRFDPDLEGAYVSFLQRFFLSEGHAEVLSVRFNVSHRVELPIFLVAQGMVSMHRAQSAQEGGACAAKWPDEWRYTLVMRVEADGSVSSIETEDLHEGLPGVEVQQCFDEKMADIHFPQMEGAPFLVGVHQYSRSLAHAMSDPKEISKSVRFVARTYQPSLETFYREMLVRQPGTVGHFKLRMKSLAANGWGEVKVESETIDDPAFVQCVKDAVKTWAFVPVEKDVPVVIPFEFSPAE